MLLPQIAYSLHLVRLHLYLRISELYQTIFGNYTLAHWLHFLWLHPSKLLQTSRYFHTLDSQESLPVGCYKTHYNPFYHFLVLSAAHSHLCSHNSVHEYPTETDIIPYPYSDLYMLWISLPEYLILHFYLYIQTLLHHSLYIDYPKYRIHHDALLLRSAF